MEGRVPAPQPSGIALQLITKPRAEVLPTRSGRRKQTAVVQEKLSFASKMLSPPRPVACLPLKHFGVPLSGTEYGMMKRQDPSPYTVVGRQTSTDHSNIT